jgi:RNA polymerase primary sigma factor
MPTTASNNSNADRSSRNSPGTRHSQRAADILLREVRFIYSAEFEKKDAERTILQSSLSGETRNRREKPPSDVPGHLLHLWEIPLLNPDEERDLFRRMNYLKYRSNVLRSRLNPDEPCIYSMDSIERILGEANEIRNHIVQANTRLVVSIARRLRNSWDAFDEMISTGNFILIRAVERFDYSRGFRFSTYATHSVQRELFRLLGKGRKRQLTEVSTSPEILLETLEDPIVGEFHAEQDRKVGYVRSLIESVLPERERRIVISRFGLNSEERSMTLREIGEEMGLSKERIRQLQIRAVERLKQFAKAEPPDSAFARLPGEEFPPHEDLDLHE